MSRVVVKIGGHALGDLSADAPVLVDLAADLAELLRGGARAVVVHGGGPQIGELLDRVGLESRFVDGLRVTDAATMPVVAMALSLVNVEIVAALNRSGVAAVGLSGVDAGLLTAEALGDPWGRAGASPRVRPGVLEGLWAAGLTPVVSSVAADSVGELVNVNADAAAGALAAAIGADALVLLSDVAQVRADPDDDASALSVLSRERARALIDSGGARDGMRPKLRAALDALESGARSVTLADGTRAHALRDALGRTVPVTEVVA
ncbi:MAG: acetylglutamate kinase [Acidobacteriota bacterium]|nr:acetylglutamate kinase [Acidobacteriota bacterium]